MLFIARDFQGANNLPDGGVTQPKSAANASQMALEDLDGGFIQIGGSRIRSVTLKFKDFDCLTAGQPDFVKGMNYTRDGIVGDPAVIAFQGSLCGGSQMTSLLIPITSVSSLAHISISTYTGLTQPLAGALGEPDRFYPTGIKNFARTTLSDGAQMPKVARFVAETLITSTDAGVLKADAGVLGTALYLINDGIEPQSGMTKGIAAALAPAGLTSAGNEVLTTLTGAEAANFVERVKAADASAVWIGVSPFGAGASNLIKALRNDPETATLPVFVQPNIGQNNSVLVSTGATLTTNLYSFLNGTPASQYQGATLAWFNRYKARFPVNVVSPFSPHYYEHINVLAAAIKAAGDQADDRAVVMAKMKATSNFTGVLGTWSFDPAGDISGTGSFGDFAALKASGTAWNFVKVTQ